MLKKYAAIDADFFIHCVNYQPAPIKNDGSLFLKIVNEMRCIPIMHQYVAEQEILSGTPKKALETLRESGKMKVLGYNDYLPPEEQQDYILAFQQAYFHVNGISFPSDWNVFQQRQAKGSLGELRTFLMAFWLNGQTLGGEKATVELLLSNDHGTKELLDTGIIPDNQKLSVYNIEDALEVIGKIPTHSLQWSDIKLLAKHTTTNIDALRSLFG